MESKIVPASLVGSLEHANEIKLEEFSADDVDHAGYNDDDDDDDDDGRRRLHGSVSQISRSFTAYAEKSLATQLRRADKAAIEAFKKYDVNGDGTIAVSELKNLAEALGEKDMDKSGILHMIKEHDTDGDLTLTLEEFKDFFHRFNKARLEEYRKKAHLIRERLSNDKSEADVSSTKKCGHLCLGALKNTCCVYYKQLIVLTSVIIMGLMIPLFSMAYSTDLATINGYLFALIWSAYWSFYPSLSIACYYYAFPKRQPIWLLVILAIIYGGIGVVNSMGLACPNAFWYSRFRDPPVAPVTYSYSRSVMVTLQATINFVLLFLYRGPVRFKGLLAFAIFLMFVVPIPSLLSYWIGYESLRLGISVLLVFSCVIAIRITECIYKRGGGKRIGGSRAYTALLAMILPHVVPVFVVLMYYAFREYDLYPNVQLALYLVFQLIKLQVRDVIAIAASSSLPDDITIIVFMFYPIFAFQFITELVLISVSSGQIQPRFITFLTIKILTNSLTKGGFLILWVTSLQNWTRRERKRHNARKTFLRGLTQTGLKKKEISDKESSGDEDSLSQPTARRLSELKPTNSMVARVKHDVLIRQAQLNCLWVVQKLVAILFSFLSNTSGQTLHDIKGMSEHQRMVQSTVVMFTLISMSNVSSLACNMGSMVVLFIEQMLPPSERVWFISVKDDQWWWTHLNFSLVLLANLIIIFIANFSKYHRWTKLQVLFHLSHLAQHDLTHGKQISVRKAKAKFLHKLYRKRVDSLKTSDTHHELVEAAHQAAKATSDEMLVDAEYHGNKLYMLERQVFRKHFWFLFLITIYGTFACASYGMDDKYFGWVKKHRGVAPCNWTLAPPSQYVLPGFFTSMCGTDALPNLNCTLKCGKEYVNSTIWKPNCTVY